MAHSDAGDQESINIQRQSGLLTETQARQRILALHPEQGELLIALALAGKTAASIGPEAVARVQDWKNEIAGTKLVVDEVATKIDGSIQDGMTEAFTGIIDGSKSAAAAFGDFGRSVQHCRSEDPRAETGRIAIRQRFKAVPAQVPVWAHSFPACSRGLPQAATVSGPGTSTSDSVRPRLSAGEVVVRAGLWAESAWLSSMRSAFPPDHG